MSEREKRERCIHRNLYMYASTYLQMCICYSIMYICLSISSALADLKRARAVISNAQVIPKQARADISSASGCKTNRKWSILLLFGLHFRLSTRNWVLSPAKQTGFTFIGVLPSLLMEPESIYGNAFTSNVCTCSTVFPRSVQVAVS